MDAVCRLSKIYVQISKNPTKLMFDRLREEIERLIKHGILTLHPVDLSAEMIECPLAQLNILTNLKKIIVLKGFDIILDSTNAACVVLF